LCPRIFFNANSKSAEIYRNIPNVTGIADDIIVSGATEQEHDEAFVRMLEATRANNVSLNSEKLQFKKQQVNFYGHTLTTKGIIPADDKLQAIKNISTPSNVKELLSLLGISKKILLKDCSAYSPTSRTNEEEYTLQMGAVSSNSTEQDQGRTVQVPSNIVLRPKPLNHNNPSVRC
jgi:hypothetical protein